MDKAPESYLDCKRPSLEEALRLEGNLTIIEATDSLIRKGYFTPRPRPWTLGYRPRGLGRGDFAVLDKFGDLVTEVANRSEAELIILAVNSYAVLNKSFKKDLAEWERETAFESPRRLKDHPAYKRIVAIGPAAIPHIITELRIRPSWILIALLYDITGEHPLHPDHAGKLDEMAKDWLNWAEQRGY